MWKTIAAATFATAAMGSVALAQGEQQQMPTGPGMMGQHMMDGQGMMGPGMGPGMGQGMMGRGGMGGCPMMGGMMGQGGQGMMGPGMMGHGMMMDHGPMIEARLAYLKADLAITDAQAAAWNVYADAVRARAASRHSTRTEMMETMKSATLPERIAARLKAMETMVESLKVLKPATEALYGVLTEEQRKKADTAVGCGMM